MSAPLLSVRGVVRFVHACTRVRALVSTSVRALRLIEAYQKMLPPVDESNSHNVAALGE